MRDPHRVSTTTYYRVKAKDVKKNDHIVVAGVGMRVQSNRKNDYGDRVLTLARFSNQSISTLVIPKNVVLSVHVYKHKSLAKKK